MVTALFEALHWPPRLAERTGTCHIPARSCGREHLPQIVASCVESIFPLARPYAVFRVTCNAVCRGVLRVPRALRSYPLCLGLPRLLRVEGSRICRFASIMCAAPAGVHMHMRPACTCTRTHFSGPPSPSRAIAPCFYLFAGRVPLAGYNTAPRAPL